MYYDTYKLIGETGNWENNRIGNKIKCLEHSGIKHSKPRDHAEREPLAGIGTSTADQQ
jgi:hypothetical protein